MPWRAAAIALCVLVLSGCASWSNTQSSERDGVLCAGQRNVSFELRTTSVFGRPTRRLALGCTEADGHVLLDCDARGSDNALYEAVLDATRCRAWIVDIHSGRTILSIDCDTGECWDHPNRQPSWAYYDPADSGRFLVHPLY